MQWRSMVGDRSFVVGMVAGLTGLVGPLMVLGAQALMADLGCVEPAIVLGRVTPGACISADGGTDAPLPELARVGLH